MGTDSQRDPGLEPFDGQRVLVYGALCTLTITVVWIGAGWVETATKAAGASPIDFRVFWAGARLALEGDPLAAFDPARLAEVYGSGGSTGWMPWAYPPGFLALLLPFGLLPFAPAWAAFTLVSLAALFLAARPFTGGRSALGLALALAPAMLPALLIGQTTLLWAAGLLGALAALREDRPILAGILIGLLTLKPQLGLLIPVALVAAGLWRAILSATLTALVVLAGATAWTGAAYLPRMLDMMQTHFHAVRAGVASEKMLVSPYSAMTGLGLAEPLAMTVQGALTLLAAALVALAWRRREIGFDLRAAVLVAAIPLSTPYLWHYEAGLLAPAALLMVRAGALPARPGGWGLATLMWVGLGPSIAIELLVPGGDAPFRMLFVPVALLALAVSAMAVLRCRPPRDGLYSRS